MPNQEFTNTSPSTVAPKRVKSDAGKRRIAAVVALSLLEVIRVRDLPLEILGSEDPSQTMPRRLGLSGAVELQIRRYREEVRRRHRVSDEEIKDLFSLVVRRPDSEEVFFQTGEMLAGKDAPVRGLKRILPTGMRFALARRYVRKQIRSLFGRDIGGFAHGRFTIEARSHFFLELDPGGEACALLAGFAQTVLSRYFPDRGRVTHTHCQALKADLCRWVAAESDA